MSNLSNLPNFLIKPVSKTVHFSFDYEGGTFKVSMDTSELLEIDSLEAILYDTYPAFLDTIERGDKDNTGSLLITLYSLYLEQIKEDNVVEIMSKLRKTVTFVYSTEGKTQGNSTSLDSVFDHPQMNPTIVKLIVGGCLAFTIPVIFPLLCTTNPLIAGVSYTSSNPTDLKDSSTTISQTETGGITQIVS